MILKLIYVKIVTELSMEIRFSVADLKHLSACNVIQQIENSRLTPTHFHKET